ncbi:hypothetical protein F511_42460 [Dorcoceras hygrometricum]|uniref:Uncharacterized protein n=1 Tax=Dorcoceras hygrometricum TaxID=472368 RepID=A0A2Z7CFD6_9LAMI|nr:hypothetical protein F511_42460 [Dorcoceras hygrometricum]
MRIWRWTKVCEEVVAFNIAGGLLPVRKDVCHAITVFNLGVERIPADFLHVFAHGLASHNFGDSVVKKDLGDTEDVVLTGVEEVNLVSSDVSTVYRSPSPPSPGVDSLEHDLRFALGPAIFSHAEQEERLYFVQSPDSPPAVSPHHESSSSSTDVSFHFDSTDVPVHSQAATHAPASVDFTKLAEILEDLQSSLAQRIHDSNCEMLSKLNSVELGVRGDLLKMQSLLRQSFETAYYLHILCWYFLRSTNRMAASLIHNALQVNFNSVLNFPDEGMVQMFKALESTGLREFLGCPSALYDRMAASLIHNALQVNFNSVLNFPDEGMVQMFKALESTGLREFLGCPSALYEQNLESFFSNATVHGDSVISCVQRKFVGISEEQFAGPLVEMDKEKETEKEVADKRKRVAKIIDSEDTEPLSKVMKLTETSLSDEEYMSIDVILRQIPEEMMLPSVMAEEPTKIKFGQSFAQLQASVDHIQLEQVRTRDDVAELKAALSSKITDLEAAFAHASTYQERVFRNQIYDVKQEIKTQKAALSRDLDDFREETQDGITTLSAQLSEIIAYINRERYDKNGEIESRCQDRCTIQRLTTQ